MKVKDKFNLHYEWTEYLKLVKVKEEDLPPVQRQEMKRAFFGACGRMFILFRDQLGELDDEEQAEKAVKSIWKQIQEFWTNEVNKQ